MPPDHFPPTVETAFFRENDAATINRHLMSTYREPLRCYYLGLRGRPPVDADDMLNGFFAKRLSPEGLDFVRAWLAHRTLSGIRLSRWLMTGLRLYVHEHERPRAFDPRKGRPLEPESVAAEEMIDETVEAETMRSFVRQALIEAERTCTSRNTPEHWESFVAHFLQGRPLVDLARESGTAPERLRVMVRTASEHFRRAFEAILARDGAGPADIDRDIEAYLGRIP